MAINYDEQTFVNNDSPALSAENLNIITSTLKAVVDVCNKLLESLGDGVALGDVATENIVPVSKGGTGTTTLSGIREALGLGNSTGALPISSGGTGASNATEARDALGAAPFEHTHNFSTQKFDGVLPVKNGGTGAGTVAEARTNLGLKGAAIKDVDTTPTSNSGNLLTSGGAFIALNEKQKRISKGTAAPSGGADGDVYIKYS